MSHVEKLKPWFDQHYYPKYLEVGAEKAAKCDEWFMANEAQATEDLNQTFKAADTNDDGLLQEHEFVDYIDKCDKWMAGNTGGISITIGAEGAAALYHVLNTFTEGTDGVSNDNMTEYMMALGELFT